MDRRESPRTVVPEGSLGARERVTNSGYAEERKREEKEIPHATGRKQ
jgi:hypothetical protein